MSATSIQGIAQSCNFIHKPFFLETFYLIKLFSRSRINKDETELWKERAEKTSWDDQINSGNAILK